MEKDIKIKVLGLDGAYNLEDIPPVTQHNPNYNYSYQFCQGNTKCQPTNKQVIFP